MSFKDEIAKDLDIFLNDEEFSGIHEINGHCCSCSVQDVEIQEDLTVDAYGHDYPLLFGDHKAVFVAKDDLPFVPVYGQRITLDGQEYDVTSCKDELGVLNIQMVANRR